MDIQVGEYARDEKGFITKIDSDYVLENIERFIKGHRIVKHSKNIIDLIEVGDYVNGKHVKKIEEYKDGKSIIALIGIIDEKDIKTIMTKEQFAITEYRLEA